MGTEPLKSDQGIISKLRTMAHWTTKEPWTSMADRFEELVEFEKKHRKKSDGENLGI